MAWGKRQCLEPVLHLSKILPSPVLTRGHLGHEVVSPLLVYLKLFLHSLQLPTTTPEDDPDPNKGIKRGAWAITAIQTLRNQ